jgi:hypothetical protein
MVCLLIYIDIFYNINSMHYFKVKAIKSRHEVNFKHIFTFDLMEEDLVHKFCITSCGHY